MLELEGHIVAVSSETLRVRGRGCEVTFALEGATFERSVPAELPVVSLRPNDPTGVFREDWTVKWGEEFIVLSEVPPTAKRER
jgi:hypothetical protein